METILVPLDGSSRSEIAISFARRMAAGFRGRLVLLHAVSTEGPLVPDAPAFDAAGMADAESYLSDVISRWEIRDVEVQSQVVDGEPAKAILRAIDDWRASFVVIGAHGRREYGRLVWGHVASGVLREAAVPVMLVPQDAQAVWLGESALKLVVPLDGSPLAEAALGPAEQFARGLHSQLVLTQAVGHELGIEAAATGEEARDRAERYLGSIAARLVDRGLDITIDVREAPPAIGISEVARHHGAQGIVMTTHGRGAGTRWVLLGTVVEEIVRSSQLPVLLVPTSRAVRKQRAA